MYDLLLRGADKRSIPRFMYIMGEFSAPKNALLHRCSVKVCRGW